MKHWADRYIGAPYDDLGAGPDRFNCWTLVRYIQRERYGRDVPFIPADSAHIRAQLDHFRSHPELADWPPVAAPREGDVVILSHHLRPHHCGLWIDADNGGILHALTGIGVCFHSPGALRIQAWNILQYRRHKGAFC